MVDILIENKLKTISKDPEDGFWDRNNSEGIVSNSQVPVHLDIRGECRFARVQL